MRNELEWLAAALRDAAVACNEAAARCNTLAELPPQTITDRHKDHLLNDLNIVEEKLLDIASGLCRLDGTDYAKRCRWRDRAMKADKKAKGAKRTHRYLRGEAK